MRTLARIHLRNDGGVFVIANRKDDYPFFGQPIFLADRWYGMLFAKLKMGKHCRHSADMQSGFDDFLQHIALSLCCSLSYAFTMPTACNCMQPTPTGITPA